MGKNKTTLRLVGNFDEVIRVLGGLGKTAVLLDRQPSQVCQWRTRHRERFPASVFFRLNDRLQRRGYVAERALFTFDNVLGERQ